MNPALLLPERHRRDFAKTRGIIVTGSFKDASILKDACRIACVGDIVSEHCLECIDVDKLLLIVDGKTRRHIKDVPDVAERALHVGFNLYKITNPPATLTMEAISLVCRLVREKAKAIVSVEGEEDMLALPAIACSLPCGVVVYGVPDVGAAIVKASLLARRDAQNRFTYLRPGNLNYP